MSKDDFSNLSAEEIQHRLTTIESDRLVLERALEQRNLQIKKDLATEIKEMIVSRGYDVADIASYLTGKKRGSPRAKSERAYARYVDPNNSANAYVRGVLPRWMKDQMAERGLNPASKEDRETFKSQYLRKEA